MCAPDSFELVIGTHGIDVSVVVGLLSRQTKLHKKKINWSQAGLEPRSLQIV